MENTLFHLANHPCQLKIQKDTAVCQNIEGCKRTKKDKSDMNINYLCDK